MRGDVFDAHLVTLHGEVLRVVRELCQLSREVVRLRGATDGGCYEDWTNNRGAGHSGESGSSRIWLRDRERVGDWNLVPAQTYVHLRDDRAGADSAAQPVIVVGRIEFSPNLVAGSGPGGMRRTV